jgi:hypothetical protein
MPRFAQSDTYHIDIQFFRELLEHIPFQTPEDKRIYFFLQFVQRILVIVFLNRNGVVSAELFGGTEHGRVEEPEKGVKFVQVVFNGCSTKGKPVLRIQEHYGLGNQGAGSFQFFKDVGCRFLHRVPLRGMTLSARGLLDIDVKYHNQLLKETKTFIQLNLP